MSHYAGISSAAAAGHSGGNARSAAAAAAAQYADVGTQPNTSNPFYKCMHDILRTQQNQQVPSIALLEMLLGCLGNQEDKLAAMNAGMSQCKRRTQHLLPCIFKIYDICQHSAETIAVRRVLVLLLRSFVLLHRGRTLLLEGIGMARVLTWLKDPAPEVRVALCSMLAAWASFPDSRSTCQQNDGAMLSSLVGLFLNDPNSDVVHSTIPALQQLTNWSPILSGATLGKLGEIISGQTPLALSSPPACRLLNSTLQTVWNSSLAGAQKDVAISSGLIGATVPLLENAYEPETRRLACGLLASLVVSQKGKEELILQPGAIEQACKLTLDRRAASGSALGKAVRDNAIALVRNFAENTLGLHKVGHALIVEPEALLAVLGPERTGAVIEPRLRAAVPKGSQSGGGGEEEDMADAPAAAEASPLAAPTEIVTTLRALLALLKTGTPASAVPSSTGGALDLHSASEESDELPPASTAPLGRAAAWKILDVIPSLFSLAHYTGPHSLADSAALHKKNPSLAATLAESVSSIPKLAQRSLLLLCADEPEARLQLESIAKRMGGPAASQEPIFALVEGQALAARQAEEAREARRAARAAAAAQVEAELAEAARLEAEARAAADAAVAEAARAAEEEAAAAASADGDAPKKEDAEAAHAQA